VAMEMEMGMEMAVAVAVGREREESEIEAWHLKQRKNLDCVSCSHEKRS
jgi:hypothetical protein